MNKRMDIKLLHRYLAGECSEREKIAVEEWIEQSEQNRMYYESIVKIWNVRPKASLSVNTDKAWHRLAGKLNIDEYDEEAQFHNISEASEKRKISAKASSNRLSQSHLRSKTGSKQVILRIAAVLLIGVGLGGMLLVIMQEQIDTASDEIVQDGPTSIELKADRGDDLEFELVDGTSGTLHAGSQLTIDNGYSQSHREVQLDGQAFFQVEDSNSLSFQVRTNEADVEVLGTSFNVTSWSERAESEIIVKTGSVGIRKSGGLNGEEQIILKQNERVVVSDRSISAVEQIDTDVYLSWLEGDIFFDDDSLENVFKYLERRFDVDIEIENDQIVRQKKVSARYKDESLEEILDITSISHELEFREENGKIIVSSDSQ